MNNKLKHFRVKVSKLGGEGYGVFKMVITNLCFCVSAEEQNQFEFHTFTATNGHKSQYFSQLGRNFYEVAFLFFRISAIWQVSQDSVYKRFRKYVREKVFYFLFSTHCVVLKVVSPKMPTKNYHDFCPGSLLEGTRSLRL